VIVVSVALRPPLFDPTLVVCHLHGYEERFLSSLTSSPNLQSSALLLAFYRHISLKNAA